MDQLFSIADIAISLYMLPQTLKYQVERDIALNHVRGVKKGRQTLYTAEDVREILTYLQRRRQAELNLVNNALFEINKF